MRVNGTLVTEKLEAASKSSNLHPGSTKKNLGGINSQINKAKAENLGQGGGHVWEIRCWWRDFKCVLQEGDHRLIDTGLWHWESVFRSYSILIHRYMLSLELRPQNGKCEDWVRGVGSYYHLVPGIPTLHNVFSLPLI